MIHRSLAHSGLSDMLYDGATGVVPFVNASDLLIQVRTHADLESRQAHRASGCIRTRWTRSSTNTAPGGEEPEGEIYSLGYSIERELLSPLEGQDVNAAFMLLADHGHIQVDEADIVPFAALPRARSTGSPPRRRARRDLRIFTCA